ncbi:hypothetical protein HYZ97_04190 [Candidatus Pacearchaeota archaeon]|nr:hypothetical protein [Candidatus Pacearchaeota archaeon]
MDISGLIQDISIITGYFVHEHKREKKKSEEEFRIASGIYDSDLNIERVLLLRDLVGGVLTNKPLTRRQLRKTVSNLKRLPYELRRDFLLYAERKLSAALDSANETSDTGILKRAREQFLHSLEVRAYVLG